MSISAESVQSFDPNSYYNNYIDDWVSLNNDNNVEQDISEFDDSIFIPSREAYHTELINLLANNYKNLTSNRNKNQFRIKINNLEKEISKMNDLKIDDPLIQSMWKTSYIPILDLDKIVYVILDSEKVEMKNHLWNDDNSKYGEDFFMFVKKLKDIVNNKQMSEELKHMFLYDLLRPWNVNEKNINLQLNSGLDSVIPIQNENAIHYVLTRLVIDKVYNSENNVLIKGIYVQNDETNQEHNVLQLTEYLEQIEKVNINDIVNVYPHNFIKDLSENGEKGPFTYIVKTINEVNIELENQGNNGFPNLIYNKQKWAENDFMFYTQKSQILNISKLNKNQNMYVHFDLEHDIKDQIKFTQHSISNLLFSLVDQKMTYNEIEHLKKFIDHNEYTLNSYDTIMLNKIENNVDTFKNKKVKLKHNTIVKEQQKSAFLKKTKLAMINTIKKNHKHYESQTNNIQKLPINTNTVFKNVLDHTNVDSFSTQHKKDISEIENDNEYTTFNTIQEFVEAISKQVITTNKVFITDNQIKNKINNVKFVNDDGHWKIMEQKPIDNYKINILDNIYYNNNDIQEYISKHTQNLKHQFFEEYLEYNTDITNKIQQDLQLINKKFCDNKILEEQYFNKSYEINDNDDDENEEIVYSTFEAYENVNQDESETDDDDEIFVSSTYLAEALQLTKINLSQDELKNIDKHIENIKIGSLTALTEILNTLKKRKIEYSNDTLPLEKQIKDVKKLIVTKLQTEKNEKNKDNLQKIFKKLSQIASSFRSNVLYTIYSFFIAFIYIHYDKSIITITKTGTESKRKGKKETEQKNEENDDLNLYSTFFATSLQKQMESSKQLNDDLKDFYLFTFLKENPGISELLRSTRDTSPKKSNEFVSSDPPWLNYRPYFLLFNNPSNNNDPMSSFISELNKHISSVSKHVPSSNDDLYMKIPNFCCANSLKDYNSWPTQVNKALEMINNVFKSKKVFNATIDKKTTYVKSSSKFFTDNLTLPLVQMKYNKQENSSPDLRQRFEDFKNKNTYTFERIDDDKSLEASIEMTKEVLYSNLQNYGDFNKFKKLIDDVLFIPNEVDYIDNIQFLLGVCQDISIMIQRSLKEFKIENRAIEKKKFLNPNQKKYIKELQKEDFSYYTLLDLPNDIIDIQPIYKVSSMLYHYNTDTLKTNVHLFHFVFLNIILNIIKSLKTSNTNIVENILARFFDKIETFIKYRKRMTNILKNTLKDSFENVREQKKKQKMYEREKMNETQKEFLKSIKESKAPKDDILGLMMGVDYNENETTDHYNTFNDIPNLYEQDEDRGEGYDIDMMNPDE